LEERWAVVGASTSGLFAALNLAQAGIPVDLYEAEVDWQPTPRTLIVTAEIERVFGENLNDALLNRISRFELVSKGAVATIMLREPDLVIDRARFMHLLARLAQEKGARLHFGYHLEAVEPEGEGFTLHFAQGKTKAIRCTGLIGADGVYSVVSKHLGGPSLNTFSLLQVRVPRPPDVPPDTVRVWFDRDSTRFFLWLIPEGEEMAAVGLIADSPAQAKDSLEAFLRSQGWEPVEYQAGTVSSHSPKISFNLREKGGRAFLVGDATGQVKVTTVGGVVAGLRGAKAVAEAVICGVKSPKAWRSLKRELDLHWLIRRILDMFTDRDYDDLLARLNRQGEHILSSCNRDKMASAIFRLMAAQPEWLALGARVLGRSLVKGWL